MFVDPGVKVKGQYYRDILLSVSSDDFCHQTGSRRHVCLPGRQCSGTSRPWYHAPSCCRERRLTSLVLTSGRQTVQTWIPSTTRSGASVAGVWITRQQRRWAKGTSPRRLAWCAARQHWLGCQPVETATDSVRACVHTGDILNICCEFV